MYSLARARNSSKDRRQPQVKRILCSSSLFLVTCGRSIAVAPKVGLSHPVHRNCAKHDCSWTTVRGIRHGSQLTWHSGHGMGVVIAAHNSARVFKHLRASRDTSAGITPQWLQNKSTLARTGTVLSSNRRHCTPLQKRNRSSSSASQSMGRGSIKSLGGLGSAGDTNTH